MAAGDTLWKIVDSVTLNTFVVTSATQPTITPDGNAPDNTQTELVDSAFKQSSTGDALYFTIDPFGATVVWKLTVVLGVRTFTRQADNRDIPRTNAAAVTLAVGDVVVLNGAAGSVRLLTSADVAAAKKLIFGVIVVGGIVGAVVQVRLFGVADVKVDGAVAIGDFITGTIVATGTNPTPMRGGVVDNSPTTGTGFAKALATKGAGLGLVSCFVNLGIAG